MKKIFAFYNSINNYVNTYLQHYSKFGKGGLYLLKKSKTKSNDLLTFTIKEISQPLFLRNNTTDITVFYQIFLFKQYQIKTKVSPKFIIDCGANVGYSSVYFANIYPEATIIAIEPEYSNFQMLLKNTEAYPNIKCLNNGIWNKSVNLEIIDSGGGNYAFITKVVENKSNKTVSAVSINDIVEKFCMEEIGVLKIDIEGSEKEMFEENYNSWLSVTDIIIIEMHDRYKYGCSKSFFKALVNYEFTIGHKGDNLICYLRH